jgi:hypothetical protein
MGDVVNLGHYRKQRERALANKKAAAKRAKFGRKKVDRDVARQESDRAQNDLDSKRIDHGPGDDSAG